MVDDGMQTLVSTLKYESHMYYKLDFSKTAENLILA